MSSNITILQCKMKSYFLTRRRHLKKIKIYKLYLGTEKLTVPIKYNYKKYISMIKYVTVPTSVIFPNYFENPDFHGELSHLSHLYLLSTSKNNFTSDSGIRRNVCNA